MLWVKYIDQSLLFNISFSNGSDNINFTLKKSHYTWERRVITCEKEGSLHIRKNGITHEKEGSLHIRKKDPYTSERRILTHQKEGSLHMRKMILHMGKKGHYMWERRVNTREKEGSLHMRKNGITHEKEGSLHMRKKMVLHMRKKSHYTWGSCVAMFLSVILYTFTVHLPFKEMFTFLLLCMNVTCSFLMFTLLNLKLKTLTSLPIKTIRFDIEQITRQKCLKTN